LRCRKPATAPKVFASARHFQRNDGDSPHCARVGSGRGCRRGVFGQGDSAAEPPANGLIGCGRGGRLDERVERRREGGAASGRSGCRFWISC
jgi:hypothetical protein